MPPRIDVTVAAVIERERRFLMVEEIVGGRHVFNQPAGHLEPNESLEAAVVREVLEETGFRFVPGALLGVTLWQARDRSFLRVTFTGDAEPPSGEHTLDDGIVTTHWFTRGELGQLGPKLRSPMVLNCIDRYLSGERYPLTAVRDLLPTSASLASMA